MAQICCPIKQSYDNEFTKNIDPKLNEEGVGVFTSQSHVLLESKVSSHPLTTTWLHHYAEVRLLLVLSRASTLECGKAARLRTPAHCNANNISDWTPIV